MACFFQHLQWTVAWQDRKTKLHPIFYQNTLYEFTIPAYVSTSGAFGDWYDLQSLMHIVRMIFRHFVNNVGIRVAGIICTYKNFEWEEEGGRTRRSRSGGILTLCICVHQGGGGGKRGVGILLPPPRPRRRGVVTGCGGGGAPDRLISSFVISSFVIPPSLCHTGALSVQTGTKFPWIKRKIKKSIFFFGLIKMRQI